MSKTRRGTVWIWVLFVLLLCCVAGYLYWAYHGLGEPAQATSEPLSTPAEGSDPLGMLLIDIITDEQAAEFSVQEHGVYVLAVSENSAAQRAGLRSGDRITALNGVEAYTAADLYDLLARVETGSPVLLTGERNDAERAWTIVNAAMESD